MRDCCCCPLQDVSEVAVFQAVAAWCQGGTLMLPASSSEAVAASTQLQEAQQQQQRQQLAAPTAGERESEPASQLSADSQHAEPVQQQPPQQQQQALRQVSPPEQQQRQVASCWRGTDEMLCMLQLVRFALMSDPDRQVGSILFDLLCCCMARSCWLLLNCHAGMPASI